MPGSDGLRIWGDFWKKSTYLRFDARRSELRFGPGRVQLGLRDAPHVVGSDGTVNIVKLCVSLSSCWKPKSQKGNKSFVPELPRVISVSNVFRIPMHILRIRIFVYSYLALSHLCILHLQIGRIFFRYFGMSGFLFIAWACVGIFMSLFFPQYFFIYLFKYLVRLICCFVSVLSS